MTLYTCNEHNEVDKETPQSPCRGRCRICRKKSVHGYTNPEHISNPFGYLFLFPFVCLACSSNHQICMWCIPSKEIIKQHTERNKE